MSNYLGKQLATLRKEKGYTQKQVADMLNISNKTLSSWEVGNTMPDLITLPKLADIYGVTCDELLREDAQPQTCRESANYNKVEDNNTTDNKIYKKKLISIYIVYCIMFIFTIAMSIVSGISLMIEQEDPEIIMFYVFLSFTIVIYIAGILLNSKIFCISEYPILIKKLQKIRYYFAISNLCIIICTLIILNKKITAPVSIAFSLIVILLFILIDKIVKVKSSQDNTKHKKSIKAFGKINAISISIWCIALIIMAICMKCQFINSTENLTYKTYNTYQEAVDTIQSCDNFKKYNIIDKKEDKENSVIIFYLSPKNGTTISQESIKDDFSNYEYKISDDIIELTLSYQYIDTQDGVIYYYVANSLLIDNGRIVTNNDATYSIIYNDTMPGLITILLTVSGVIIGTIITIVTICGTILSIVIYDAKLFKKQKNTTLQENDT